MQQMSREGEMRLGKLIVLLLISSVCLFSLGKEGEGGCLDCHPRIKERIEKGRAHSPVKEERCTRCHSPHTSDYPHLLKGRLSEVCARCHKEGPKMAFSHLPVQRGECGKCHDPHGSPHPHLLRLAEKDLCLDCHKKEKALSGKALHAPAREGCLDCHRAHGSAYGALLLVDPGRLCLRCHEDEKLPSLHGVARLDGSHCITCHDPHAGDERLLGPVAHPPFADGNCGGCHRMEGERVGPVERADRELCLSCHEELREAGCRLYSHIQSGLQSNPCLDCHSPHLSKGKDLLRREEKRLCFSCHRDTEQRVLGEEGLYHHPDLDRCSRCHEVHGSNELTMLKGGGDQDVRSVP